MPTAYPTPVSMFGRTPQTRPATLIGFSSVER
jgi:hypothetical protein